MEIDVLNMGQILVFLQSISLYIRRCAFSVLYSSCLPRGGFLLPPVAYAGLEIPTTYALWLLLTATVGCPGLS